MKKDIVKPTLLIDPSIAKKNLTNLSNKADLSNVIFRPHFKTHQSQYIGQWFKDIGVSKITVSSVEMASYFANDGWNDITLAFPTNIRQIDRINEIAKNITLNILVESEYTIQFLSDHLEANVNAYIKIDVGTRRTGIPIGDSRTLTSLISKIKEGNHLSFKGFVMHAGHTYSARSKEDIQDLHQTYISKVSELAKEFGTDLIYSVGDTPSCSIAQDFGLANEIRPGNFIFYDVMQEIIGSCSLGDIAVCLACPIVAKNEDRSELLVHGGGVHLSKDRMNHPSLKNVFYGYLAYIDHDGWSVLPKDNYVSKLSQEHGTVQVTRQVYDSYSIGDLIGVLPIHSCMTANLMKQYQTLDGTSIPMMSIH